MFLVAAATSVGAVAPVDAQGLRGVAPSPKQGESERDKPVAENSTDIIVTATRRSQRLSQVPITVNAYGANALSHSGATDIRQASQLSSSLSVSSTGSEANASARLRGIGTLGDNPGLESSVAVFIDGVYRNRTGSGLTDLGEVERIEVLHGPQGTLSGRNASAGVISIYSKYPEFQFGGFGEASYGNYNAVRLAGGLTGPVIKDTLAFRIDGLVNKRDGFYRDTVNATDYNDRNRYFLRSQLFFRPQPDLSLRLIGDYTYRNEKCCGAVYYDTRAKVDPTPNVPGDYAIAPSNGVVTIMKELGGLLPSDGHPYNRQIVQTPGRAYGNVVKDYGGSARIGWTIGGVQLISISAYREYKAGGAADLDYSNLDLVYRSDDGNAYRQFHTFTQETRLSGALFGNRLDWLVGGYFAHETLDNIDNLKFGSQYGAFAACRTLVAINSAPGLRDPSASGCLSRAGRAALTARFGKDIVGGLDRLGTINDVGTVRDAFRQTSDNFAFFTHNIYRLTDTLSLTGGLRYTNEYKRLAADFNNNNVACLEQRRNLRAAMRGDDGTRRRIARALSDLSCAGSATPALNGMRINDSIREGQFTGTAVVSWQPRSSTLLYGSYARGYKAGGFNLTRFGLTRAAYNSSAEAGRQLRFDPETVQAYELGIKYSVPKFSAGLAAFRSAFRDFQLNTFSGNAYVVQNASACSHSLAGADRDEDSTTGACSGKVRAGVITQGIELDAGAYPTPDLTFNLGYTYAHTQYRDDLVGSASGTPLAGTLFLLPGNQMANAPRHVVTGSATWTPALGGQGLTGLFYVDSRMTSDYNTGSDLFLEKAQDGFVLVNARIGIRGRKQRWAVEFWGQNLFNADYQQLAFTPYLQGTGTASHVQMFGAPKYATGDAVTSAYLAEPRTYGVTLRSRF